MEQLLKQWSSEEKRGTGTQILASISPNNINIFGVEQKALPENVIQLGMIILPINIRLNLTRNEHEYSIWMFVLQIQYFCIKFRK